MWLLVICVFVVFVGRFGVVVCGICDEPFCPLCVVRSRLEVGIADTRREVDLGRNSEMDE